MSQEPVTGKPVVNPPREAEPRRVLVVDDEPDILTIMRVMLQNAGFTVLTADNGLDAVRMVYNEEPDCVILDVMMPRMNGYQVCRLLKHDPRTRNIPIIFCTVKSLEMDRLYGQSAGADHYLGKPFDPGELLRLVNESLRHRRPSPRRRSASSPAATTDAILTEINLLLDQKLREYTILQHVSRAIAGTLNIEDLLRIILHSITSDLGFPRGFFLLLMENGVLEERLATEDRRGRLPWRGALSSLPGLRAILEAGNPEVLGLGEIPGVLPEEIVSAAGLQRVVVVPVIAKGRSLGLILVDLGGEDEGGEDILTFFMTLAGQAGLAIENAQLYAKTLQMSITDGLTGLFNYRYFMDRLESEFTRARRYDRVMSLLILDIDHFKDFNDRYGHLHGDEILRRLAVVLRGNVREVDVVARYGGEEFAVILPETTRSEAIVFAERIRVAVVEHFGEEGGITVSIGVSSFEAGMESAQRFIKEADNLLYEAKRGGRNRVAARLDAPAAGEP